MQRTEAVSGFIVDIEPVHKWLSIVTLSVVEETGASEVRLPFYSGLGPHLIGKYVEITTDRLGFWAWSVKQEIRGAETSAVVELPYSFVKRIQANLTNEMRQWLSPEER